MQITLPPGATKTPVFNQVSDSLATQRRQSRRSGVTTAGRRSSRSQGESSKLRDHGRWHEYFGAFRPVWRSDGSRVSYRTGTCTLNSVPVTVSLESGSARETLPLSAASPSFNIFGFTNTIVGASCLARAVRKTEEPRAPDSELRPQPAV